MFPTPREWLAPLAAGLMATAAAAAAAAQPAPAPTPAAEQAPDLVQVADAIAVLMRSHHYDPAVETDPEFLAIEARVRALAETSGSREDFVTGFNRLWREGPFSHVRLSVARASAQQTAAYLDTLRVGGEPVRLEWRGQTAILTVDTMMGLDTIELIEAAYGEIAGQGAEHLIIDLRANSGGAFAVRPLVAHVIAEPLDGGVFVSRGWTGAHEGYPTLEQVQQVAPWEGWSVRAFWADLVSEPFIRMQIAPAAPHFAGQVTVLTSNKTASAAELAVDALAASGRASVIGERTAGQMLSQTFFDLPGGLQLALPVGDYHAWQSGRIEGTGIAPDIHIAADEALDAALSLETVGKGR